MGLLGDEQDKGFTPLSEYSGFRDMFDGGGAGRPGDTFQGGGLLSDFANAIGLRPMGYAARQDAPGRTSSMSPGYQPGYSAPPPVTEQPMPMPVGPMTTQQMIEAQQEQDRQQFARMLELLGDPFRQ